MSTIADLLEQIYPERRPQGRTKEWKIPCISPDCPCKKPDHNHLQINEDKEVGYCFRCTTSFSAIDIVSTVYAVSRDTAKTMVLGVGVERVRNLKSKLKRMLETLGSEVFDTALKETMLPLEFDSSVQRLRREAKSYLQDRRVGLRKAQELGFGICLKGYWRGRLIIPIYRRDQLLSFQARALWGPPEHLTLIQRDKWIDKTDYKKVLFPIGFQSKRLLYSPSRFRDTSDEAILVEGDFDAINTGSKAYAQFGLNLSEFQLELLREEGKKRLCLFYDYGEYEATRESAEKALLFGFDVYIADCPRGFDPGSLPPAKRKKALEEASRYNPKRRF